MRPRDILAANIADLMARWPDANKHKRLMRETAIPNGTLGRIEKAQVSAGGDWLEQLASALGVEPWELLVPPERREALHALAAALRASAPEPESNGAPLPGPPQGKRRAVG